MYQVAKECLEVLSTRLGERRKYFYGDTPRLLDALVFGEIVALLYAPIPNGRLRQMILEYPNLLRFVENIRQTYFADGMDEPQHLRKDDQLHQTTSPIKTAYEAALERTRQLFSSKKYLQFYRSAFTYLGTVRSRSVKRREYCHFLEQIIKKGGSSQPFFCT